jgi:hypothetical protein
MLSVDFEVLISGFYVSYIGLINIKLKKVCKCGITFQKLQPFFQFIFAGI